MATLMRLAVPEQGADSDDGDHAEAPGERRVLGGHYAELREMEVRCLGALPVHICMLMASIGLEACCLPKLATGGAAAAKTGTAACCMSRHSYLSKRMVLRCCVDMLIVLCCACAGSGRGTRGVHGPGGAGARRGQPARLMS